MQFTSIPFFIFLFFVVVAYYSLPHRYRNYLLLAASYYFYFSVQPEYLVLLIGSTMVNYLLGRGLDVKRGSRKPFLIFGLLFNLGILFFFKYFNFFGDQVNAILSRFSLNLNIPHHSLILPIGISFYTFMALGYILDVYWQDIKAQRNLLIFSTYLAFFPQILCGPIGRAKNLFKQYSDEHSVEYANFSNGFRLILWGMFKKMVVADNIMLYVDAVFNNAPMHTSVTFILAILLFPLQLYADFSGYTDIARGVGKLFGFDLQINFQTPYVNSVSITDYWRRNHISLTSWIRDYVFFPFMGHSMSRVRVYLGILIMFSLSGVWHGASWMFIIWGLLQTVYLVVEDITGYGKVIKTNRVTSLLRRFSTYLLLSIGLLFFRVPNSHNLYEVLGSLANNHGPLYKGGASTFAIIITGIILMTIIDCLMDKNQFDGWIAGKSRLVRWFSYQTLALVIILFGNVDGNAFIYFQF